jgi:hypothetical protein
MICGAARRRPHRARSSESESDEENTGDQPMR